MPTPILALTYLIHLLATVGWFASLLIGALTAWPDVAERGGALEKADQRLRPWGNVSLAALIVTGLIQMGGDSHYEGFLKVDSPWAVGLLAKHLLIGGVIAASAYSQMSVRPALERARLAAGRGGEIPEDAALRRRTRRLAGINLALGLLILVCTALITAY